MKVQRNGKAAALTPEQFERLVGAAPSARYAALWTLQRLTAARIGEALALTWGDVAGGKVTFRRSTTKTKATRQVPQVRSSSKPWPTIGRSGQQNIGTILLLMRCCSLLLAAPQARNQDKRQTKHCAPLASIGLEGVSLHSFRRTAAQDAVDRGLPLHVVQKMTGHKSLGSLGEYLQATEEEVLAAIGGWLTAR